VKNETKPSGFRVVVNKKEVVIPVKAGILFIRLMLEFRFLPSQE